MTKKKSRSGPRILVECRHCGRENEVHLGASGEPEEPWDDDEEEDDDGDPDDEEDFDEEDE